MRVFSTIADFRSARAALRGTLGLVPTMGYLHEAHLELVRRAKAENPHAAATIFVNPTQFGPKEDFTAYPRDFERDRKMLESVGCDLLFAPPVEEMYPTPTDVYVVPGKIADVLEGAIRPGHFRGVATVVAKLFNITGAERAYFGQKDGQQVAVIKRMVRDLNFPIEIVVAPTVREPDGLAMSSRNVYLTPAERAAAPIVYRALRVAEERFGAGERDAETLRQTMRTVLATEPMGQVDYTSVADEGTLQEVAGRITGRVMASLAVRFGKTRLIDNVTLG